MHSSTSSNFSHSLNPRLSIQSILIQRSTHSSSTYPLKAHFNPPTSQSLFTSSTPFWAFHQLELYPTTKSSSTHQLQPIEEFFVHLPIDLPNLPSGSSIDADSA